MNRLCVGLAMGALGVSGLGFLAGWLAVARYNLRTFLIVRRIRKIYGEQGRPWSFWTDPVRRSDFRYSPERLIEPGDGGRVLAEKRRLVAQGQQGKAEIVRTALRAVALAGLGFAAAVVLLVAAALLPG